MSWKKNGWKKVEVGRLKRICRICGKEYEDMFEKTCSLSCGVILRILRGE